MISLIVDKLEKCITKLKAWKNGMENRGLRVNMNKTKFMISDAGLDMLRHSGAFPVLSVEVEWEQTLLAVPSTKIVGP